MRVAIALFDNEVSPRFCHASSANLYEWDGRGARLLGQAWLGDAPYPDRLRILASYHAEALVCGAFPCAHLSEARDLGILVLCGGRGPADELARDLGAVLARGPVPCDQAGARSAQR